MSETKTVGELKKFAEEITDHIIFLKDAYVGGRKIFHAVEGTLKSGKKIIFTGERKFAEEISPLFQRIENVANELQQLVNKLHEANPEVSVTIQPDETSLPYVKLGIETPPATEEETTPATEEETT